MIENFTKKLVSYGIRKYSELKYSKYKPGHIFNIEVGNMSFKMTFMDYDLVHVLENGLKEEENEKLQQS